MQHSGVADSQPSNPLTESTTFRKASRTYRYWIDKSVPYIWSRWLALLAVIALYGIRVYFVQGFYIVTYALGIYTLNLLLGFLTPQIDPEMEGPTLPSKGNEEFRPFVRRLPEFKFWYAVNSDMSCCFSAKPAALQTPGVMCPRSDMITLWLVAG